MATDIDLSSFRSHMLTKFNLNESDIKSLLLSDHLCVFSFYTAERYEIFLNTLRNLNRHYDYAINPNKDQLAIFVGKHRQQFENLFYAGGG